MENSTRHREIKAELIRRGFSMKAVAEDVHVTPTFLYLVLRGDRVSRPVASHVERLIGAEPGSLFPYVLEVPQRGPGSRPAVNE
jgi:transcriptional regulator with XRE-family HTH domain